MKYKYIMLALTVLVSACDSSEEEVKDEKGNQIDTLNYTVASISKNTGSLLLTGRVTTNPNETVVYKPLSDGIVLSCSFAIGDYVKVGQQLLTVRSRAFYELQTEVEEAKGKLRLAQRELRKSKQMFEDGLLAEQNLIETQLEYDQAQLSLGYLQATMKMYGTTVGRGIYQVNAQSEGYIFSKNAMMSSTISPEEAVYTISSINHLLILANVYATSVDQISVGQEVEITSPSCPNETFQGKIAKIYPYMDAEEKVMKVQIEFENKRLALKPDFMVDVNVKKNTIDKKISIPSECLIFDKNKFYAVIKKNGELERQEVNISYQNKDYAIIEKGLLVGDSILSEKQLFYFTQLK